MNNLTQILDATIQANLIASSLDKNLAATITKNIISDLVRRFGRQMFYLPNNNAARIAEKHKQILADLNNGLSHVEIYRKYRIGSVWLKKLIKRKEVENDSAS